MKNKIYGKLIPIEVLIDIDDSKSVYCVMENSIKKLGTISLPEYHPLYEEAVNLIGETDINLKPIYIDIAITTEGKIFYKKVLIIKEKEPVGHQLSTKDLNGIFKIELSNDISTRKKLTIVTTIKDGMSKTKFDVRVINTSKYYDKLIDAMIQYNSIK